MFIKKEEKDMTYGTRTRNRTEIMSQILRVANGVGATKTTLMNKAFLHYAQLQDYLMVLTQTTCLAMTSTLERSTTKKGLRFTEVYNQMDGMIKAAEQQV
jgi:predicted transcriptional regulator